ncbi:MAG TPA: hypothetical protein VHL80_04260 [Polyangia bacterium]|nr:hypothetical protein [Polyangia bacterium]
MIKKISLAALLLLGGALAPLACGGGSSSPGSDFCAKYATAVCQRDFACPDPANPLPFTMSQCVQGFTQECTNKPPAGQVPDVNCYGATQVNATAQTMCLQAIPAATCDEINNGTFTYDDVCGQVCTTATTGAAGSTSGAGGATGAAGSTTGAAGSATGAAGAGGAGAVPPDGMSFCLQLSMVDCDRAYDCVPAAMRDADFVASEGNNITECKGTLTTQACDGFGAMCGTYSTTFAQACLSKYATETCDQILADMGPPAECFFACQ